MKDKYKTLIISCWVVLLCCFVVKLLGGNFFEVVCENEKYIAFTKFVSSGIPYWVISILSYVFSSTIYFMAITKKQKPTILFFILNFIFIVLKLIFVKYATIMMIIESIYMIVLPIFYKKKLWLRSIIGYILCLVFQLLSMLIKNMSIDFMYDDIFTNLIFSIDYYIMLILYWLYSIKEEDENVKFRIFIFRNRGQRKH